MSVFKSPELKEAILARYNGFLAAFPFEKLSIDTRFGKTFALAGGVPEAPAVILLHGSCSNSAFWFPELTALSPRYRVYALDIPGEAGNSCDNRRDLHTEEYADWLSDVLDSLGIGRASVAGNSLGGWMALRFAMKYPTRVEKLALFAPGGLSDVNKAVFERAKRAEAEGKALTIDSLSGGDALPAPVIEFMNLILAGFNPITEGLPIFSDEQIARLNMPVLFVGGADDDMLDMPAAARRLGALVPGARVLLIEGAAHMITNAAQYLVPFLTEE